MIACYANGRIGYVPDLPTTSSGAPTPPINRRSIATSSPLRTSRARPCADAMVEAASNPVRLADWRAIRGKDILSRDRSRVEIASFCPTSRLPASAIHACRPPSACDRRQQRQSNGRIRIDGVREN